MGTIRTFDPELRKEIYNEIRQIAEGVAQGTGTEIAVEFDVGGFYPVTVNDKPLLSKLKNSLVEASEGFLNWKLLQRAQKTFHIFLKKYQAFIFG